jgi:hypothetical protein
MSRLERWLGFAWVTLAVGPWLLLLAVWACAWWWYGHRPMPHPDDAHVTPPEVMAPLEFGPEFSGMTIDFKSKLFTPPEGYDGPIVRILSGVHDMTIANLWVIGRCRQIDDEEAAWQLEYEKQKRERKERERALYRGGWFTT